MGSKYHPEIGERHGRYTIISIEPKGKHSQTRVKCLCDCGVIKTVDYSLLISGKIVSCGCYGKEKRIAAVKEKSRSFQNKYEVIGNDVFVKASNSDDVFIIDLDKKDDVLKHRWFKNIYNHVFTKIDNRVVKLHRFIMGVDENNPFVVDHINGNTLDNRVSNLRICTQGDNCINRKANTHKLYSKYKGVYSSNKGRTFWSTIEKDGKRHHLGSFDSEIEAALAYDQAAKELFGEFAKLNFQ